MAPQRKRLHFEQEVLREHLLAVLAFGSLLLPGVTCTNGWTDPARDQPSPACRGVQLFGASGHGVRNTRVVSALDSLSVCGRSARHLRIALTRVLITRKLLL